MGKPTLRTLLLAHADAGVISMKRNLYPRQEKSLIGQGFTVRRLGIVPNYPNQFVCRISWSHVLGRRTFAYQLLMRAAEVNPEVLTDVESHVPVPSTY